MIKISMTLQKLSRFPDFVAATRKAMSQALGESTKCRLGLPIILSWSISSALDLLIDVQATSLGDFCDFTGHVRPY